jgi:hypothetical protein
MGFIQDELAFWLTVLYIGVLSVVKIVDLTIDHSYFVHVVEIGQQLLCHLALTKALRQSTTILCSFCLGLKIV